MACCFVHVKQCLQYVLVFSLFINFLFSTYLHQICIFFHLLVHGAHSGDAMWVVRVDMTKRSLSPIPSSQDWAHGVPA